MEKKLDQILKRMNEIELNLKSDIQETNAEIKDIKKICTDNQNRYTELNGIVQKQQSTINFLHKEVNKNNIIIMGIVDADTNILETVMNIIVQKLQIEISESDIISAYRLGKRTNTIESGKPVKVCLYDYRLKCRIFNARRKLMNTQIYINEDLPLEYRLKNKEARLLRKANNRKRLLAQSSEESDGTPNRIVQDPKRHNVRTTPQHSTRENVAEHQSTSKN